MNIKTPLRLIKFTTDIEMLNKRSEVACGSANQSVVNKRFAVYFNKYIDSVLHPQQYYNKINGWRQLRNVLANSFKTVLVQSVSWSSFASFCNIFCHGISIFLVMLLSRYLREILLFQSVLS